MKKLGQLITLIISAGIFLCYLPVWLYRKIKEINWTERPYLDIWGLPAIVIIAPFYFLCKPLITLFDFILNARIKSRSVKSL